LHIDLDSNPKRFLPHIRIADNNRNNRVDVDSNCTMRMRMQILKSDNHIMHMQILIIIASAFAFSPLSSTTYYLLKYYFMFDNAKH
jgi:hypothetical protein